MSLLLLFRGSRKTEEAVRPSRPRRRFPVGGVVFETDSDDDDIAIALTLIAALIHRSP